MNSCIKNPKILLLKCSIEYLYREETKFTCIDPIVLQVRISGGNHLMDAYLLCCLPPLNFKNFVMFQKLNYASHVYVTLRK